MDPQKASYSPSEGPTGVVPVQAAPPNNDTTLSDVLLTLRKRKWVILGVLLLFLAYGFYKGATQVRVYEAAGRIEIRSGSSNQYRVSPTGGLASDANSGRIPTEIAILQSETLLVTVARDLDLPNNPLMNGGKIPAKRVSIDDPIVRQGVLGFLGSNLHVQPIPKTDIIRISFTGLNPKLCAEVINTLIDEYRQRTLDARLDATKRITDQLSKRLVGLQQQVETSQAKVLDLQRRLGVLGFDPSHNQITNRLDDLAKAATTYEIQRILADSRYRTLRDADPSTIDALLESNATSGAGGTPLTSLRKQLTDAEASYAQLLGNLDVNHPQAKALKAQIDALEAAVNKEQAREVAQAQQTYVAARANEQQTGSALEAQKNDAFRLRDDLVQYTIAQRQFDSDRTLYEGLLQRIQSASVQAGLESQEIDIVDPATVPTFPSLQPRSSILIMNGAIGLVAGIILAFILESLDTGLRSVAEIENVTGLASLALIPRARRSGIDPATLTPVQRNLAVLANPKSQFAEAFRALRTSLLLSTAGHPPRTILLTSATPSEGKTTISTNLACVLAQRDVRVLLIDADLRRPTVHHRFGLNGRVGLTSVLTGSCTAAEAIQKVPDVPNLDILASGPVPPFPTEMLGSSTMNDLIKQFETEYTHIVIDSPPLLSVTDGVVLAREADATVLIVRHGKSSKHVVRRARDLVLRAGAPLTGIVLNAVDLNSPEYYGYYGYSGYGYAYAGVDTDSWSKGKGGDREKGDRA